MKFGQFFVEDLFEINMYLPGNPNISHLWKGNTFKHALVAGYVRSDQGIVKRFVKWFSKRKSKDFEGSHFLVIGMGKGWC